MLLYKRRNECTAWWCAILYYAISDGTSRTQIYTFFPHRNFKLLSFGEEAEEDEEESSEANRRYSGRSKSTHDILNDPYLSAVPAVETKENTKGGHKRTLHSSDSDSALSEDEAVDTGYSISYRER